MLEELNFTDSFKTEEDEWSKILKTRTLWKNEYDDSFDEEPGLTSTRVPSLTNKNYNMGFN